MEVFLQHCINGVALGSIYGLIALGYTMVYGILRLINFAHSDVFMVGAFAGFYLARGLGITGEEVPTFFHIVLLISAGMVACAALGMIIERFAYRPLRLAPRLNALITAIGVSLLLEYTGQLFFGADPKFFPPLVSHEPLLRFGEAVVNASQILILVVSLFLMALLQWFVRFTKTGMAMRAVSFNYEVSELMGISVKRIIVITFIIGSALAGAAGILVGSAYPKIEPLMGVLPGLKAFVAAVLGGIGSLPGAMVGGLLMGLTEEMVVSLGFSPLRDGIAFALLIILLLWRPEGLFGKAIPEKV